jgi:3-methyl-2-oxobutanoate hydroxymethyltransferase
MSRNPITVKDIRNAKETGRKVVMLTAYDYHTAQIGDAAELDMLLVGDSLGMVVYGLDSTVGVTIDDMIRHTQAVRRGCKISHVVADMPFLTYNTSIREAIYNAGLLLKAGGDSVKLEGGVDFAPTIEAIVKAGIPVVGHIGLTPQTISALGGFKAQGRDEASARAIVADALAVEQAGAYSVVLEAVPSELGQLISQRLTIPVIGIGAGPHTDGQVLVYHDLIGLYDRFVPKFVKQFAQLRPQILQAMLDYRDAVRQSSFPAPEHCFRLNETVKSALADLFEQ